MKRSILVLFVSMILVVSVSAQDCKNFIYMTNGKVVTYSATNPKGKLATKMVYSVVAKTGNKATVNSKIFDDKGKEVSATNAEIICEGNSLKIDMRNFMPSASASQFKGMTVKADASYLSYPAKMQVGQQLPEGTFNMEVLDKTQKIADVSFKVAARKVEALETVTTPAGSFECYKISYNGEIKTTSFGIAIPFQIKVTEWYAPKLGLYVKSEASNKSGKLMSTTTLDRIN